jgi:multiple sugar transport system substrate-binding protein/raffinose/stachyose/melibiose transport system substrate-binding protein
LSQAAKDAFTHNGVAYGIPQAKNTVFCYYNIGYFEAAGITELPTNFDEFIEVCEKLKAAGYRPFGIAGAGPNNMAHSLVSQGILYQIIESGYDPDWVEKANAGEYDYDTRQWRHLLDKAVILRDGDYFQPGFKSADYTEAVRVMAMGEVAMTFHQNILYMQLVPEAKKNGFDIGIMPIPWNDPGQQQCGQWSFEGGPALGDNDNGMEKVADVFFDYIAYDKYYLFQNQTAATSPFETDPPDLIVDEFLAKNVEIINGLSVTGGYAALVFPAPVYSQVKNFIQEVIFGTAAPEDIGEFLNPAQQEYADSIK